MSPTSTCTRHSASPYGRMAPGVGPIGVCAHLKPFQPGHEHLEGAASGMPAGLSSTMGKCRNSLAISWAYIALMGGNGLKRATEVAILNANYMAHRLEPHFPVLYKGTVGRVGVHECIIDVRALRRQRRNKR